MKYIFAIFLTMMIGCSSNQAASIKNTAQDCAIACSINHQAMSKFDSQTGECDCSDIINDAQIDSQYTDIGIDSFESSVDSNTADVNVCNDLLKQCKYTVQVYGNQFYNCSITPWQQVTLNVSSDILYLDLNDLNNWTSKRFQMHWDQLSSSYIATIDVGYSARIHYTLYTTIGGGQRIGTFSGPVGSCNADGSSVAPLKCNDYTCLPNY